MSWSPRLSGPSSLEKISDKAPTDGADHIIAIKTQAERWGFDGVDLELLERIARDLRTLLFAFDNQSDQVDGATAMSD